MVSEGAIGVSNWKRKDFSGPISLNALTATRYPPDDLSYPWVGFFVDNTSEVDILYVQIDENAAGGQRDIAKVPPKAQANIELVVVKFISFYIQSKTEIRLVAWKEWTPTDTQPQAPPRAIQSPEQRAQIGEPIVGTPEQRAAEVAKSVGGNVKPGVLDKDRRIYKGGGDGP